MTNLEEIALLELIKTGAFHYWTIVFPLAGLEARVTLATRQ